MVTTSAGREMIAVGAILLILNTIAVGARIYTRIVITRRFQFNDGLLVIALGAFAALYGLLIMGVEGGIGGHILQTTIPGLQNSLKAIFFLEIIYVVLTSAMKGSIALTFIHLSRSRILTILFWVSIAMDFLISAAFIIYLLVQCQPIDYAWRMLDPTARGKCLPLTGQLYMGYALCIVTAILDVMLLVSPWIMMRGRGLNSRLKLYIYGIFGLGILATIANIIRLAALVKLTKSQDQLFDAAPVFTWSAIEVSIGIIIAGLIELGPLAAKYGLKGFESYTYPDTTFPQTKPNNLGFEEYELRPGKV
ncbi:hypothetical protein LZ32DRAFT_596634 [Colletotrichum eremochloae]|nr:hypothetical protein LZ32DRAFT_596634 [Colletotrichum eremochloae]